MISLQMDFSGKLWASLPLIRSWYLISDSCTLSTSHVMQGTSVGIPLNPVDISLSSLEEQFLLCHKFPSVY